MVRVLWAGLVLLLLACTKNEAPTHSSIDIIPKPAIAEVYSGYFDISSNATIKNISHLAATLLHEYLAEITGLSLDLVQSNNSSFNFEINDNYKAEEYHLSVTAEQVHIIGGSELALLHGVQTIRQLLLKQKNKYQLPIIELHDQPRFQWRGLLLDCSRHFMDKDFVKKYIDLLALHKMNVLHWHLTEDQGWRIEIKKYPSLTEIGAWRDDGHGGKYGGYYSQEDIREVVSYATSRGVTVVPEIELPGHSLAALAAFPHLSCTGGPFDVGTAWGVYTDVYCAGNEETFMFLENVLSEVIALFPSAYVHIGGDEVPKYRWEQCQKCQKRIRDEGLKDEHELQSYFIRRIEEFMSTQGKQIIGWDEILEGGISHHTTVQSWRGYEGAIKAVKHGNQAIVSPTSHAYFDYDVQVTDMEKVYAFDPIPTGLSPAEAGLIIGGECNMWTERTPQDKVDAKVFPRILAMAEVLWSDDSARNYSEFKSRVKVHYPVLDRLEVSYGFESTPATVHTITLNDTLWATIDTYDNDIRMFYRKNNGSNYQYTSPIPITTPSKINVTFSQGSRHYQDTLQLEIFPHMANGTSPRLKANYHQKYTAGGAEAMVDGKKGSKVFRDGNWQGYQGDDVEVTIDLGEVRSIETFSSNYLQDNGSWIFYPTQVAYYYSLDGKEYTKAGEVVNTVSPEMIDPKTKTFTLSVYPKDARYVKMVAKNLGTCPDGHSGSGEKAWLFVDEFIIL